MRVTDSEGYVDFPRRYLELTLILQTHIHSPQIDTSLISRHPHQIFTISFPDPFRFPPAPPPKLINFIPVTPTGICKLIWVFESKQCPLDSIPTLLSKLCFYELGPTITNLSLSISLFYRENYSIVIALFKFWNQHHFHWYSRLDELEQTASLAIKKWFFS